MPQRLTFGPDGNAAEVDFTTLGYRGRFPAYGMDERTVNRCVAQVGGTYYFEPAQMPGYICMFGTWEGDHTDRAFLWRHHKSL